MAEKIKKVLVVDDDSFIRDVLEAVLEGEDYSVVTAENGAVALAAFHATSDIGFIISDINMPEMGGMELIRQIRESGSNVPIIILTGSDDSSLLNGGANDYLLKDENISDTVIPMIEKVLAKHALEK